MSHPKPEELSNEDLLNKLESVEMTYQVMESPDWAWFREAWKRIHDEADRRLETLSPYKNPAEVLEAQYAKRFYKHVLKTTVQQLKDYSDVTYHEAKERGLINRFVEQVRAKIGAFARR